MSSVPDHWQLKRELMAAARENCASQYDDLFRTFSSLDTKAQATATFAGVQLAAILALLGKDGLQAILNVYGLLALGVVVVTVIVLLAVIAASILAMRVREVPEPYLAVEEVDALMNLQALPHDEFVVETAVTHLVEHLQAWRRVLNGMSSATALKAQSVEACQWVMLLGLSGTTLTFFISFLALQG